MSTTKLTLTESTRNFDRYRCSNCGHDNLIGGAERPNFCYQCGYDVSEIDERTYYGPCHGCVHGEPTFDDPCLLSSRGDCINHNRYKSNSRKATKGIS